MRIGRTPAPDTELLDEIRRYIADLPSYRYCRDCVSVNPQRRAEERPAVNPKQACCVMAEAKQLLPKAPRRSQSNIVYDGKVVVEQSNTRWCSDGIEIKCDSGEVFTTKFAKDCCDREIMAWRARPSWGLPGEPMCEMLK